MQDNQNQKNIVFFMVDQLSAKWLELAIQKDVCPLPNIKKMMDRGTYFNNAISSNPVCCPTRATIATGRTTRSHGVLENGYKLDPNMQTFMHVLQDNDYTTGAFGKLHFRPHYESLHPDYKPYGFDVTHITEDGRGGEWLDEIIEKHPEHLDDILATIWASKIPEFKEYGKDKLDLQTRIQEIRQNYDWTTEEFPDNVMGANTQKFPKEISQTAWITRHALNFLNETDKDKPIFAHISYVQPHGPYNTPPEYMQYVDESKIPEPIVAEWFGDETAPKYFHSKKPGQQNHHYYRKCYFADLVYLDEQLSKIVDCLKEIGRYENTLMIFLADHGELLGDHGFYSKAERHYDACIRVPFIVAGENMGDGKVHNGFVQHEDICPTVLDFANCSLEPLPFKNNEWAFPIEKRSLTYGKSLLPICKGKDETERKYAYSESYNNIGSMSYLDWARTIRSKEYRYTYYPDFSGDQLFDLVNDPDETVNLAYDPKFDSVKRELKDNLMEFIIRQDYPKTPRDMFGLGAH